MKHRVLAFELVFIMFFSAFGISSQLFLKSDEAFF